MRALVHFVPTSKAMNRQGGDMAMNLRVAEKYVDAFGKIAQQGNTMIVPSNAGDVSGMVAQALGVYKNLGLTSAPSPTSQSGAAASGKDVVIDGGFEPTIPDNLKPLK